MRKGQLIRKLLLHYKSSIAVIKTTPEYEEDFNKLICYVRDRKIVCVRMNCYWVRLTTIFLKFLPMVLNG